ncbi:MAG: anti-sigma-B factor antagonist [Bryobacteraceae bacterium]|nr:MAG: anti-sigma-B factor antagonist [Bryobacteraceae bacterium]
MTQPSAHRIESRQEGDVTVIRCQGRITLGLATNTLRNLMREALDGGAKKLLVDFSGATQLDSTGIGELVGALSLANEKGAELKLAAMPPKIRELLRITRLDTVFDVRESYEEALKSFR